MNNLRPPLHLVRGVQDLHPATPNDLLQAHIADFLQTKRRRWRPKTYTMYITVLKLYAAYVGPDHWPPTRRSVLSWLDALEQAGN
ncbi:MAG TPA: hypothetical protein VEC93_09360, partial [Anaerolineae bacterium]|nr:hypothetical protein [Anaerolineae bacterium]